MIRLNRNVCAASLVVTSLLAAMCGCTSAIPHCAAIEAPTPPPPPVQIDYALVEARAGGEVGTAPQVEIQDTPAYKQDIQAGVFKAAAIRLPDSCLITSSAGASGISNDQQTQKILSTNCGVRLKEIERALTKIGFKVYSWDALRGLQDQKHLSPYDAGRELGADVVFVFNSLAASALKGGGQAQARYKYFASNAKGERLKPLPLEESTRAQFKQFAKSNGGISSSPDAVTALSCTLNSTAIVTGSNNPQEAAKAGESIWFYKRTVTHPVRTAAGMRFLFARLPGGDWTPAVPDVPKVAAVVQAPRTSTEDVESQTSGSTEDAYAVERLKLIHEAAEDFVTKFQNGAH